MPQLEKLIKKYFELVNSDRFDELFEMFAPDAEFHAPFDYHAQGLDNIKPFYFMIPDIYPRHVDIPVKIIVSQNQAAVLIEFTGQTAAGVPIAFRGFDWFVFAGEKIKSLNIFFDVFRISNLISQGGQT